METKRFDCMSGKRNEVKATVELNGVSWEERLTPKMAARAAMVAFGHRHGVTVSSNDRHAYRLYPNSARMLCCDV